MIVPCGVGAGNGLQAVSLRRVGFRQTLEQPVPPLSWRRRATPRFLSSDQDRERSVAVGAAAAGESEEGCDGNSQGKSESDEIPEGGESDNKNQGAARGEEQANKSATEGKPVHGDTRMAFLGHGAPLLEIIPLIARSSKSLWAMPERA